MLNFANEHASDFSQVVKSTREKSHVRAGSRDHFHTNETRVVVIIMSRDPMTTAL